MSTVVNDLEARFWAAVQKHIPVLPTYVGERGAAMIAEGLPQLWDDLQSAIQEIEADCGRGQR